MKTTLILALVFSLMTITLPSDNPFYSKSSLPFETPDFSNIRYEHYMPAFEAGMAAQLEEIQKIATHRRPATFDNTIVAMEKSGALLTRVSRVFFNMTSAHTNADIQRIQAEISPKLAGHSDAIYLNKALFERIQSVYSKRQSKKITPEQRTLIEEYHRRFLRAGAMLNEDQKNRIREINTEMSGLSTQFQANLLAITNDEFIVIDNRSELDGLSDDQIAAAAERAASRGYAGNYLITLTNTTRQPVTASLHNRELRQRIWEASAYRGLGRDGLIDNRELIRNMARLRAERAAIMGYDNWAAFALEPQTAKSPENVLAMLSDMVPVVTVNTKTEAEAILERMRKDGINGAIQPWDWEYYGEQVRKATYDLDESEVRPYFELNSVLENGVFYTMNRLFGIQFNERTDLPVYHPDVRVFDVIDHDGNQIGLFYGDFFARDSKRGGAWMSSFVSQSGLLNQKPVIINVLNIPKPAEGEPALISFSNVTTLFHEMGHGVHGLFSDVVYPSLAGTSVPRDYVEFPSTFQEDWAVHPEVLQHYARHYQTGEVIPPSLLERVVAANNFNQGFDTMEYLAATLLDMEWHLIGADEVPEDVEAFERQALEKYGIWYEPVPPRYRSAYFSHIFAGGYAASYYAYIWSEILAADAFAFMRDNGSLSRDNGDLLRSAILSRGGSKDPMELYRDFRGQDPDVQALMIRRGLR